MSDPYHADLLTWTERQAALLRQVAAGRTPDEVPDWLHIIEEVESAGRGQVDAVESWLLHAFVNDLKAEAWPLALEVPEWRGEARGLRARARRKYRPSMQRRIDIASLYADALQALPEMVDGLPPLPVAPTCPFGSIDEALAES